ncbi:hypothetical protein, partial [Carboxydothermus islandicus]|uniref:hypothetical protein n=1 Tax=Carboxydothermus islandicus TaxID=661089 RepID=UPI001F447020
LVYKQEVIRFWDCWQWFFFTNPNSALLPCQTLHFYFAINIISMILSNITVAFANPKNDFENKKKCA